MNYLHTYKTQSTEAMYKNFHYHACLTPPNLKPKPPRFQIKIKMESIH